MEKGTASNKNWGCDLLVKTEHALCHNLFNSDTNVSFALSVTESTSVLHSKGRTNCRVSHTIRSFLQLGVHRQLCIGLGTFFGWCRKLSSPHCNSETPTGQAPLESRLEIPQTGPLPPGQWLGNIRFLNTFCLQGKYASAKGTGIRLR